MATLKKNLKKQADSGTATKSTKKVVKESVAKTDEGNIKDTVKKVVESQREVKYIYPEDIAKDQIEKKKFRASARTKNNTFLRQLDENKRNEKELAKVQKAYASWRKTVYLVP